MLVYDGRSNIAGMLVIVSVVIQGVCCEGCG